MWMLPKHLLEKDVADGQAEGVAAEQPARSAPGRTGSRSGRAARRSCWSPTPTTTRGRPYIGRARLPRHPEPGDDLPRAQGQGRRPGLADRLQYMRQTEYPAFRKAYQKYRYPSGALHVLRLQPEGSALRRPPRAPGVRPRHRQAGADRRRAAWAWPGRRRGRSGRGPGPTPTRSRATTTTPRRRKALLAEAGWKDRRRRRPAGQGRQGRSRSRSGRTRATRSARRSPRSSSSAWARSA